MKKKEKVDHYIAELLMDQKLFWKFHFNISKSNKFKFAFFILIDKNYFLKRLKYEDLYRLFTKYKDNYNKVFKYMAIDVLTDTVNHNYNNN